MKYLLQLDVINLINKFSKQFKIYLDIMRQISNGDYLYIYNQF